MKNMKLVVSVLFLGGVIGFGGTSARAAGGVISKDATADGSYCHTKFESIREETLALSQPVLKDAADLID